MADPKSENRGIILFDGHCHMCHGLVKFIIPRDPGGYFQFASLQSEVARRLLSEAGGVGHHTGEAPDSVFLIENNRIYSHSTAALRISRRLRGLWKVSYLFILVPRPLRDVVYRWIARNRYRFFGRSEHCMLPTPEQRERFLENQ